MRLCEKSFSRIFFNFAKMYSTKKYYLLHRRIFSPVNILFCRFWSYCRSVGRFVHPPLYLLNRLRYQLETFLKMGVSDIFFYKIWNMIYFFTIPFDFKKWVFPTFFFYKIWNIYFFTISRYDGEHYKNPARCAERFPISRTRHVRMAYASF